MLITAEKLNSATQQQTQSSVCLVWVWILTAQAGGLERFPFVRLGEGGSYAADECFASIKPERHEVGGCYS